MDFDLFDKKIKDRRENDDLAFQRAFDELASVVNGTLVPSNTNTEITSAVGEILKSIGANVPKIPEDMTDINMQLEYMLRPSRTMRRRIELVGDWWNNATGSMLGNTTNGDVIAIIQRKSLHYEYKDIKTGEIVKINKKTSKNISKEAFCFYQCLPDRRLTLIDLWKFALKSFTLRDIIAISLFTLVITLIGLVYPYANEQIFNTIIPSGSGTELIPLATFLLGAAVSSILFAISRSFILIRITGKMSVLVQSAIMIRIISLPATFFRKYSSGELSTRTMSVGAISQMLSASMVTVVITSLFSLIYIFQMKMFTPTLVIPGIIILLISVIFSLLTVFIQVKVSRNIIKVSAKLSGLLYSILSGIQKIKLTGAEKRAFSKWAAMFAKQSKFEFAPPMILRLNTAISTLITMGGALALYYFAASTHVTQADYMAFNTAYGMVSGALIGLSGVAMTIANIKPTLELVKPIIETAPEPFEDKKIVSTISGKIEIDHLSFKYNSDSPLILDNLSLTINAGEYVAIVGKTGSGKSTLLRLLLGFEAPDSGAIYYDGHDINTLDMVSLRKLFGINLQDGKLFSGDIISNILVTAPWKTLQDAWAAAELAGIKNEIEAMPMGMSTMISEAGSGGVSGGQRQRILIARSLVSNPKILFFDEATSSLDNITQDHVVNSLQKIKCTRVVIAHRLSTVQQCDRIIVINNGKIEETGDYDDLMAKKGLFYQMALRQTV